MPMNSKSWNVQVSKSQRCSAGLNRSRFTIRETEEEIRVEEKKGKWQGRRRKVRKGIGDAGHDINRYTQQLL